jgi:hypothetical protein
VDVSMNLVASEAGKGRGRRRRGRRAVAALALAVVAGTGAGIARADESAALKECTVETKVMAGEFARLGSYMKSPEAEDAFARQLLSGADAALRRAQEACRQFPEMADILVPLAQEVARIDRSLAP